MNNKKFNFPDQKSIDKATKNIKNEDEAISVLRKILIDMHVAEEGIIKIVEQEIEKETDPEKIKTLKKLIDERPSLHFDIKDDK